MKLYILVILSSSYGMYAMQDKCSIHEIPIEKLQAASALILLSQQSPKEEQKEEEIILLRGRRKYYSTSYHWCFKQYSPDVEEKRTVMKIVRNKK